MPTFRRGREVDRPYVTDPVLRKNGVKADYWKTGTPT